jgi:hypothetical protein
MKTWRVYYRRKQSKGFDTRVQVRMFIHETVSLGGTIHDIKHTDRSVSAATAFSLLREARVKLTALSNME